MKFNKIFALLCLSAAFVGCENKLPYDLKGVEHGVTIHIEKKAGTDTKLSTDITSGNYAVIMSIPKQQGDYSMLKEAQLTAVYTDGTGKKKSATVKNGITSFPADINFTMAEVCSALGISSIEVGDRIELTPSYTLKSGTQVNGWSELGGWNNTAFTGWTVDGGSFTYKVSYSAFAPFYPAKFIGTGILQDGYDTPVTVTLLDAADLPGEEWMPKGITADDLMGIQLEGDIFFGGDVFKMWINKQDYTLIIPDQVICPGYTYGSYGTYDAQATRCEGEIDTKKMTISFYMYSVWGPYSFGDDDLVIQMPID